MLLLIIVMVCVFLGIRCLVIIVLVVVVCSVVSRVIFVSRIG